MSEKIITNDEIKLYTGVSGSSAKLDLFNKSMTALLANTLGIKQFAKRQIVNEEVRVIDDEYIRLRTFPVDADTIELFTLPHAVTPITGYTFLQHTYDFRRFDFINEAGTQGYILNDCVFANYTGGFVLQSTIEVVDNNLDGEILTTTTLGVDYTYTFVPNGTTPQADEIEIGLSISETLTNISVKTGGIIDGAVLTLDLGVTVETSDSDKITIENPDDLLDELKLAIAYLVAGAISDKSQIEGVSSYRMGTKTVTFRDTSEQSFTNSVIEKYTTKFNKALILG